MLLNAHNLSTSLVKSALPSFLDCQALKISRITSFCSVSFRNCRAVSELPSAKEGTEGAASSAVDAAKSWAGKRVRTPSSNGRA